MSQVSQADLRIVVPLGDKTGNLDKKLRSINADGNATEFFATSIEAIRLLSEFSADRKALVILSDGKAEDKAYDRTDVINAARKAGVIIYGIGFAEKSSETPDLQVLKRLAEDTYGPFVSAEPGTPTVPKGFSEKFYAFLENGGEIKADLTKLTGPVRVELSVQLDENTKLVHSQSLFISAKRTSANQAEKEVGLVASIFGAMNEGAGQWAQQNKAAAAIMLAALPLILLFLVWVLARSSKNDVQAPEAATAVINNDHADSVRQILGWFEMVDDQTNCYDIFDRSIRIGRHSDNDFQLNNDSVHRHHALFQFLPDMSAVISDLDTVNGVSVNGARVSKIELTSGDLIQLGEVRFRLRTDV